MNLEIEYKATIVRLDKYMMTKNDLHIQAVLRYNNFNSLHSVPKEVDKYPNEAGTLWGLTTDVNKTT